MLVDQQLIMVVMMMLSKMMVGLFNVYDFGGGILHSLSNFFISVKIKSMASVSVQ